MIEHRCRLAKPDPAVCVEKAAKGAAQPFSADLMSSQAMSVVASTKKRALVVP